MIDLKDVLNIHNILIDKFGGSMGVRDIGLLESALARPFASFEKQDLYIHPSEKAAAVLESILINHPFIDGNKRTAYVVMQLILLENSLEIIASQDEKYDMIIAASTGLMKFDDIKSWLENRIHHKYNR